MKRMLKAVSLILCIVLLALCVPLGAFTFAVSAETESYYTYTVTDGKATITDCNTAISGDITIPSTLGGYPVTAIGSYAFDDCTNLTSITIPNSVTEIGIFAFYSCTNLTEVHITDLAAWCDIDFGYNSHPLYHAHNLYLNDELITDLEIPDTVTEIKPDVFSYCTSLTSVTVPSSVTEIGSSAFEDCTNLTEVHITDLAAWCGIDFASSYGTNPLYYAKNLYLNDELVTDVEIPDTVTEIKPYVFYNCSNLTSATILNAAATVGTDAFSGCPVTLYGHKDSPAERYADANGFKFVAFPEKIKVFSLPDKTAYALGQELDLEGLIIAVYYPDGVLEFRYKGFSVSGFDAQTVGKKTVTLEYLHAKVSFDVAVSDAVIANPTAGDMLRLRQILLGSCDAYNCYDFNGDSVLDVRDLVCVKKKLAG